VMSTEKPFSARSGWSMLGLNLVALLVAVASFPITLILGSDIIPTSVWMSSIVFCEELK